MFYLKVNGEFIKGEDGFRVVYEDSERDLIDDAKRPGDVVEFVDTTL